MGTNFYLMRGVKVPSSNTIKHIGKRSAAGIYCWDCGVSLASSSLRLLHSSVNECGYPLESCPICGKTKDKEDLSNNSAGRELGFNKSDPMRKKGVKSVSSFLWAVPAEWFYNKFCVTNKKIIKNEYGDKYTYIEFLCILRECPIQSWGYDFNTGQWS